MSFNFDHLKPFINGQMLPRLGTLLKFQDICKMLRNIQTSWVDRLVCCQTLPVSHLLNAASSRQTCLNQKTNLCSLSLSLSLFVINKFACCVLLQSCYPSTKALGEIYRLAKSFHFDPTKRDTVNTYILSDHIY